MTAWSELLPGPDGTPLADLVYEQYERVYGEWPDEANEIVLIQGENIEASDLVFYALGLLSTDEVNDLFGAAKREEEVVSEQKSVPFDEVLGTTFKLVFNAAYYSKNASTGVWEDIRDDEASLDMVIENSYELRISGILKPSSDAAVSAANSAVAGSFGCTAALTDYVVKMIDLVASTYKFDLEAAESYLADYTDDEPQRAALRAHRRDGEGKISGAG